MRSFFDMLSRYFAGAVLRHNRAGQKVKLGRVWPHMLRHSCGYYLANTGSICARRKTISAIAIPSTPCATRAWPAGASRDCGDNQSMPQGGVDIPTQSQWTSPSGPRVVA